LCCVVREKQGVQSGDTLDWSFGYDGRKVERGWGLSGVRRSEIVWVKGSICVQI